MKRLGEVVAVEDDLSLAECPAARDGEDPANVFRRQALEQRPVHVNSVCHRRDIRNVGRANDGTVGGRLLSDAMSTHPSTQDEIARLRHEERLVRAAPVGTVSAHLSVRRGTSAVRASFH